MTLKFIWKIKHTKIARTTEILQGGLTLLALTHGAEPLVPTLWQKPVAYRPGEQKRESRVPTSTGGSLVYD